MHQQQPQDLKKTVAISFFYYFYGVHALVLADSDSPGCGGVVGQKCRALALPSEAVSGLVVAGDHRLGLSLAFALLWHGPVPLTSSLLQPTSAQTPFLQVDPT